MFELFTALTTAPFTPIIIGAGLMLFCIDHHLAHRPTTTWWSVGAIMFAGYTHGAAASLVGIPWAPLVCVGLGAVGSLHTAIKHQLFLKNSEV